MKWVLRFIRTPVLLAAALPAQNNLELIGAYYGVDRNFVDVTGIVRAQSQPEGLGLQVGADSLGGDPFPGRLKTLRIYYKLGGQFQQGEWKDSEAVAIGQSGSAIRGGTRGRPNRARTGSTQLTILRAIYGAGSRTVDVTTLLQSRVQGNLLDFDVTGTQFGDPAPGTLKELVVTYQLGGLTREARARDGERLRVPPDAIVTQSAATPPADGVCFYPGQNYQGTPVCTPLGQDQARVTSTFGSLRLRGTARQVELFESANYSGRSVRVTSDLADLSQASGGFFGASATWAPNLGSFRMRP